MARHIFRTTLTRLQEQVTSEPRTTVRPIDRLRERLPREDILSTTSTLRSEAPPIEDRDITSVPPVELPSFVASLYKS
ncbi:hypothetical protein FNYG_00166 [Fusarium nygamai]|uniref:Uncharacterized protein n=1 Tax=Gibberella nygamai TaxID=42673 RepID=A0A2K0WW11_GIBNY|nr:hypothetical protein FNYG_00166 [Fusarium nygamai]